jgi:hypothetical protein
MCDPFALISTGLQVVSAVSSKKAADKAAKKAQDAGDFNAQIIERDIELLEKTQGILNANFLISQNRAADAFEREIQGAARSGFGYAGVDMSVGTPVAVLRHNAREFDYEQKVREFDNSITNMQIDDEQESLKMAADLSRMEGGAQAAGLRSQGTASLLRSFANTANFVYDNPGAFRRT